MSLLTRPSVVFAIVFCCFAVLIPRVFLPLFRTKPSSPSTNHLDEHFRRPPIHTSRNDNGDTIEHIPGSPPHMRGAHPHMRMHHSNANDRQHSATEHKSSKSIITLALPMYTVGIGVFFVYTCCKYWSKTNADEHKTKDRYLSSNKTNDLWKKRKSKKPKYDVLDKDSAGEETKEEFYSQLDPGYVEYLKLKKEKALEAEKAMTPEQKQMHHALEDMKKSLSFISSKLVSKENRGNLHTDEIVRLQEHLASTEAQMCRILMALDTASDKVSQMTKVNDESIQIEQQKTISDDESSSSNEDDDSESNERNLSRTESTNTSCNSTSDDDDDQSAPVDEYNGLVRRKFH